MKLTLEYVSPEMAAELLKHNYKRNRRLRQSVVNQYARDMLAGRWDEDVVDPICISNTGELLNGQHRLTAIIQSGVGVNMYIERGVYERTFYALDNGAIRKAPDLLTGIPNSHSAASVARAIICMKNGSTIKQGLSGHITSTTAPTRQEVVDACILWGEELDYIVRKGRSLYHAIGCGSLLAYSLFVYIVQLLSMDGKLDYFESEFRATAPENKTVSALKFILIRGLVRGAQRRLTREATIGYLLLAYEAIYQGREITRLHCPEKYIDKYSAMVQEAVTVHASAESLF